MVYAEGRVLTTTFHLLKSSFGFPLLASEGTYHHWAYFRLSSNWSLSSWALPPCAKQLQAFAIANLLKHPQDLQESTAHDSPSNFLALHELLPSNP